MHDVTHLPPEVRPADHRPWVPHARPDGLPPRGDCLLRPVVCHDLLKLAGALRDPCILFLRDEVWVRPLAVQIVEGLALFGCKLLALGELALAPGVGAGRGQGSGDSGASYKVPGFGDEEASKQSDIDMAHF